MDYEALSNIFGKKFSIAILDTLYEEGEMRNKDLKHELGSAPDSLTNTLNILRTENLIERNEENKANVTYKLTNKGRNVTEKIRELSETID